MLGLRVYPLSDGIYRQHVDLPTFTERVTSLPDEDPSLDDLRGAVGKVYLDDEYVALIATDVTVFWTMHRTWLAWTWWSRPVERVDWLVVNDGGPRFPEAVYETIMPEFGADRVTLEDLRAGSIAYRQVPVVHRIQWLDAESGIEAWRAWGKNPTSKDAHDLWSSWNAEHSGFGEVERGR